MTKTTSSSKQNDRVPPRLPPLLLVILMKSLRQNTVDLSYLSLSVVLESKRRGRATTIC
jgi:hypothetical protein